jgi:hypothetical protein
MNEEMNKPAGMQMGQSQNGRMRACRCPHHMTVPILIVAVGIILLLSSLDVLTGRGMSVSFALLVIVAGVLMAIKRSCRCCCKDGNCQK